MFKFLKVTVPKNFSLLPKSVVSSKGNRPKPSDIACLLFLAEFLRWYAQHLSVPALKKISYKKAYSSKTYSYCHDLITTIETFSSRVSIFDE